MHAARSLPLNRLRRWLGLALLALLASQWLALAHGVVHAHGASLRMAAEAVQGGDAPSTLPLFAADDEGSALCHLLQSLAHAAPLVAALPVLAAAEAVGAPPQVHDDRWLAPANAPYAARGPPLQA
jgi:hypothetical protein